MDKPLPEKSEISLGLVDPPSIQELLAIDTENLNKTNPNNVNRLTKEFDKLNDIRIDCSDKEAKPYGSRISIEKDGSFGNFYFLSKSQATKTYQPITGA
jgi:hypothetical protein